ncbi:phage head completion protein [Actinokineospora inagensis]|uniref:phage head completion protein n=1 Tax=Actinokineospora inagensis TaxID=103730 RepID=UPI0004078CAE|nr:head-tail adaptor protein [Actinokineospora inagensis]
MVVLVLLPHRLVVITPVEMRDEYDNPTPVLDYGPTAPRRTVAANVQPLTSTEPAVVQERAPVVTRWRVFTREEITARERVVWDGRVCEVDGRTARWAPRFGHVHYELVLRHVEG